MQGGHHPDLGIDYYEDLFRSIKERYPIHLHALSPPEIQHISRRSRLSIPDTLTRLRDAGLDSIPGGGGEILVDRVRDIIAPKKTKSAEWLNVMRHAHRLGMSTTATMMYGHVETVAERVEHMRRIRDLQDETHGFRAFISWTFQDDGNRLGAKVPRETMPTVVRLPAHPGRLADLPRQRRPHPVELGHAGDEDRPGRARVRRRRPRLDHDRGERRLRRRHHLPRRRRTTSSARSRASARSRCSATRCTATSASGTNRSAMRLGYPRSGVMRRLLACAVARGCARPARLGAGAGDARCARGLMPCVTFEQHTELTPHGPVAYSVITAPAPDRARPTIAPVLGAGTVTGPRRR